MKLAICQINPTIGAFEENSAKIIGNIQRAKAEGCELAVFPEMSVCGYPPLDLLLEPSFVAAAQKALGTITSHAKDIGVVLGTITRNKGLIGLPIHNSAVFLDDGMVKSVVHKQLLPTYDVFDESRYFEPGKTSEPINFKGRLIGVTVCEDIWNDPEMFPSQRYWVDPVAELARHNLDLFINISASPFELHKRELRHRLLAHISQHLNAPCVLVNQTGGQDNLVFDGASFACSAEGELFCQAKDFEEDFLVFDTKVLDGVTREVSFSKSIKSIDEEAIFKALCLSIKDYATRCGFKKVCLGLSGGIDSSLVAAIAAQALGKENVLGVLMPSEFTSRESIEDAHELARNLGIATVTVPISPAFEAFRASLSPVFKNVMSFSHDLTEENLQPRIRGVILMAISNKFGHLVLATGNKSEMGVGYCTLYGDMAGGFAPLVDLPKHLVYKVSRYVNSKAELIPERVFVKPPTAELRHGQTDQDDLPSYDVVDAVIKAKVEEHADIAQIVKLGFDEPSVRNVLKKLLISEYKRRQAPPGPKLTSKAFGTGRRLPLAHGFRYF